MQTASRALGGYVVAIWTVFFALPAHAATCGDANRNGTVTVTDGVLVLRAAVQLQGPCPPERCDMNIDGGITVTDGVLALRLAAGVPTRAACSAAQTGNVFGALGKTARVAGLAAPAVRTSGFGTTTPCSGGGFIEDPGFNILTYVDCRQGDFQTNGTAILTFEGNTATAVFSTSELVVSTGEIVDTSGVLEFTFRDFTQIDGTLLISSTVVGEYSERYESVLFDAQGAAVSGTIFTNILEGRDFFANLRALITTIYSATLAQVQVSYVDGFTDFFTFAPGLCEPCGSGCSNASLSCVSCVDQCSGATDRCSIEFDNLACEDGIFGPAGSCEPCTSNAGCDASKGFACYACERDCTGDVKRCVSSRALIECADGVF